MALFAPNILNAAFCSPVPEKGDTTKNLRQGSSRRLFMILRSTPNDSAKDLDDKKPS
jgi:hypothetical protein